MIFRDFSSIYIFFLPLPTFAFLLKNCHSQMPIKVHLFALTTGYLLCLSLLLPSLSLDLPLSSIFLAPLNNSVTWRRSLMWQAVVRACVVLSMDRSSNLSRQAPASCVNLSKSLHLSEPWSLPL